MYKQIPTRLTVAASTPSRFQALMRALSQAALASTVAGCGSDPAVSESGWDPITCDQGHANVRDAKTTRAVDYLAIYRQYSDSFGPTSDAGSQAAWTMEAALMGSPCSGVADATACKEQLAEVSSCDGVCKPFAVAGADGKFERLDSRAELLKLLGDVDAVADAVLLAVYDGHTVCNAFRSSDPEVGGATKVVSNGYQTRTKWEDCGTGIFREELAISSDGKVEQLSYKKLDESMCAIGRRPFGLCTHGQPALSRTSIGAYLAQAAHLEAASVYAFQKLVRELEAFGAPQQLIDSAIDAIEDELAHTRDVARLARAYGATTVLPEVETSGLRSKLAVALDNISEGCVRETFGAAVATYQAECAGDPRVRAVMRKIAEDETQHARFSWELQAWLASELSDAETKLVEAEKTRAMQQLGQALESGLEAADERALGFPSVEAATSLFNGLRQTLWAGTYHAEVA